MEKLTNKEEEIMKIIWRLKKAFVKEVMEELPDNKPHYNTLSTIVRNLEDKKFVGFTAYGKTHQYHPIISMKEYYKAHVNEDMVGYFDNSYKNLVSFFAKEEKISIAELKEIINLIENKK